MTEHFPTLAEAFAYLDKLRESGITNMFGAGEYLERELGMTKHEARAVLSRWEITFDRDVPPSERAARALGEDTP